MTAGSLVSRLLPASRGLGPAARRLLVALFATISLAVAVHVAHSAFGAGPELTEFFDVWLYAGALIPIAVVCVVRARLVASGAGAWLAMALAVGLNCAGQVAFGLTVYEVENPPYPSWADAGWLTSYVALYGGLWLLLRAQIRPLDHRAWLDAMIAALALAAVAAGLVIAPVATTVEGGTAAIATNVAYPLGDLLMIVLIATAFVVSGWRPGPIWRLLGITVAVLAATDSIFVYRIAVGSYQPGTLLDSGWLLGYWLLAWSAWQRPHERAVDPRVGGIRPLVIPLLFVPMSIALLVLSRPLELPLTAVLLAAGALMVAVVRMALAFRELQVLGHVRRQAATDELTGLPNRRQFHKRLREAIDRTAVREESLALLLLDLDQFKELNDTLGHRAGDLVLSQIGPRLTRIVRAGDLARLGGDEFAVVLKDASAAETVAERLSEILREPFEVDGIRLRMEGSIGIALFPEHGRDAETLLQRADIAMYRAKADRSGHCVYVDDGDEPTRERLELMSQLRDAVDLGQLELHYQPLVDLHGGEVVSVEALVRWRHPERGLLLPAAFLTLADQTKLMRPLTHRVLDLAVAQCSRWMAAGHMFKVAVNVSASSLVDLDFVETVRETLARHQVPPNRLQLELTENVAIAESERGIAALDELAALEVDIVLDDYGTGYASLAQLKRLAVSELKIDRSFVAGLADNSTDTAIVRSTLELARALGLRVVAEGVEDEATLTKVRSLGVHIAQGSLYTRPLPVEELDAWLPAHDHHHDPKATASGVV